MYSSILNTNSPTYIKHSYTIEITYYQAKQMTINESDHYTFCIHSDTDLCSSLYENDFDPSNPLHNQLLNEHYICADGQSKSQIKLHSNMTYILLMTTRYSNQTGAFSVIVSGPSEVIFDHLSKCISVRLSDRKNDLKLYICIFFVFH